MCVYIMCMCMYMYGMNTNQFSELIFLRVLWNISE